MATLTLVPHSYDSANSDYYSISSSYPISNSYTDTSSGNYSYIQINTGSRAESYITYTFDYSDLPENAVITNVTVKAKGRVSSTNYIASAYYQVYDGNTAMGSTESFRTTTATVYTLDNIGTWTSDNIRDLRLRVTAIRGTSNTNRSAYFYFYGAEVIIEYTTAPSRTVTTTLSGNGTIDPSGATTTFEGDEFTITITPTNKSETVTVRNNGTDVSSQLVAHGAETSANFTANDVSTHSIQSGSSYAQYAVGRSADNPYSSNSNMYASSGSTGYAEYTFDFSDIPSGVEIIGLSAQCYGHRESSTISSSYVSKCALYSGSYAISDEVDFPSTRSSMITVTANELPTRSELDDVTLRHFVGYYGGLVLGITLTVEYSTTGGSTVDHYTYTFTVGQDATVAVIIGGTAAQPKMYQKVNGAWVEVEVVKVYKKINGSWVEQSDLTSVFDSSINYIRG